MLSIVAWRHLASLTSVRAVAYEKGALRTLFYPGPPAWKTKPLIAFVGGGDSTLEELYFELFRRRIGAATECYV